MKPFLTHLLILVGMAVQTARASETLWGWQGGCPVCPEHVTKHALTQASWVQIDCQGAQVYTSKTAIANWTQPDRDVNGWHALGLKVIIRTFTHPPDLTDAEIMLWQIEFNRQCLNRYGDKLEGIEPSNEPWLEIENAANPKTWGYKFNRLGASHTNAGFWVAGKPGDGLESVTPAGVAWLTKLRRLHVEVRKLAAPLGIKVYGPHWSNPRYINETAMFRMVGGLDGIDVFTFGCEAKGEPDGHGGWATWIDQIIPMLGGRPWAVTEFHLRHAPNGPPDAEHARQIRKGMQMWRAKGVQCVLVHTGLQNWYPAINKTDDGGWFSMAGYIDDRTSESLRALQVELAAQP